MDAIVPFYNEENTVVNVVYALCRNENITKVIAIDDGSIDNSYNILSNYCDSKLILLKHTHNKGKGEAIRTAMEHTSSDKIIMVDADLIGLTQEHINELLSNDADMVIGLRDKKNILKNMIMFYFPLTGGERVINRYVLLNASSHPLSNGWGIESILNHYCKKNKLRVVKKTLFGLDHSLSQYEKRGFFSMLKEVYDVVIVRVKLLIVKN